MLRPRQAASGLTSFHGMVATGSAARCSAATRTGIGHPITSPAPMSSGRTRGPGHHQGQRGLQSGLWRTDQARQALVLPLGTLAVRRQLRREHVLQPEREQAGSLRLRAFDRTRPSFIRNRQFTRPDSRGRRAPKHKFGMTFDQENFCACTTGIGPQPGGVVNSPEAGNDRRFPLQRFVTVDWNTPVSNRLLIDASAHPPRRTMGRHGAAGGQAGQHRPPGARHDLGRPTASTLSPARR